MIFWFLDILICVYLLKEDGTICKEQRQEVSTFFASGLIAGFQTCKIFSTYLSQKETLFHLKSLPFFQKILKSATPWMTTSIIWKIDSQAGLTWWVPIYYLKLSLPGGNRWRPLWANIPSLKIQQQTFFSSLSTFLWNTLLEFYLPSL